LPLEIVWSPRALHRLQEIRTYVAKDKQAASRLAMRIVAVVETLAEHPYIGRAGIAPEIRELVIAGTPYVVLYRVEGRRVVISTIWHGAQRP